MIKIKSYQVSLNNGPLATLELEHRMSDFKVNIVPILNHMHISSEVFKLITVNANTIRSAVDKRQNNSMVAIAFEDLYSEEDSGVWIDNELAMPLLGPGYGLELPSEIEENTNVFRRKIQERENKELYHFEGIPREYYESTCPVPTGKLQVARYNLAQELRASRFDEQKRDMSTEYDRLRNIVAEYGNNSEPAVEAKPEVKAEVKPSEKRSKLRFSMEEMCSRYDNHSLPTEERSFSVDETHALLAHLNISHVSIFNVKNYLRDNLKWIVGRSVRSPASEAVANGYVIAAEVADRNGKLSPSYMITAKGVDRLGEMLTKERWLEDGVPGSVEEKQKRAIGKLENKWLGVTVCRNSDAKGAQFKGRVNSIEYHRDKGWEVHFYVDTENGIKIIKDEDRLMECKDA
ncbi:MAG: hypothetical protein DRJ64_02890 [Thermoprotei archaeon]|nr:MAG: hypothetical protein DRJ64_02890 [Thermoprotei archaeon]